MEIILKQDVKNLGYKNDLVKVKNGYALNFLIPQDFAMIATESNKKMHAENLKQRAYKESKIVDAAEKLAKALEGVIVKVATKAGESGKIFGSITSVQLAEALKKVGHEVDRRNITLDSEHIKTLGTYAAKAKLHKDITATINFEVVSE